MSHSGGTGPPQLTPHSTGIGRGRRTELLKWNDDHGLENYIQEKTPPGFKLVSPVKVFSVVASKTSSSTRRKQEAELEGRKEAMKVRQKLSTKIQAMNDEIDEALSVVRYWEGQVKLMEEKDPQKMDEDNLKLWRKAQAEITTAQEVIAANRSAITRLEETLEFELSMIKEDTEIKKGYIDLEQEEKDEQRLDSGDEEKVSNWDKDHQSDQKEFEQACFGKKAENSAHFAGTNDMKPLEVSQQLDGSNVVAQLVTALGQAFGGGNFPRTQIVTKQVDKDLPIFSGKPEDWLTFKSEYERTNLKYGYDLSEKVVRLRKYLSGSAKEAVNHLLANPNNAQRIMEVLEDRFGKPKHVLDSMIAKVNRLPPPDVNKPQTIIDFGTAVDALVTNIISYEKTDYLNNIQLLKDLVGKLPVIMKREWYRFWSTSGANEDLKSFHQWIYSEVKMASEFYTPIVQEEDNNWRSGNRNRRQGVVHAAAAEDDQNCTFCGKGIHRLEKCFIFKKKNVIDRRKFVRDKKLCYLCLGSGHLVSRCFRKENCGEDGYDHKHHQLLHMKDPKNENHKNNDEQQPDVPNEEDAPEEITAASNANNLPIISVIVKGPKGSEKLHALLDTGASFSMLEQDVANRLGLTGTQRNLKFKVFGDVRNEPSSEVSLQVSGDFQAPHFYPIRSVHTIPRLGLSGRSFNAEEFRRRHPHLKGMKAQSMKNAVPKMIIGFNALGLFAGRKVLEAAPGETPVAVQCLLGWYVAEDPLEAKRQFHYSCLHQEKSEELHRLMTNFFSTESFGVYEKRSAVRSKEDNYAQEILESTTHRIGNRWETALLWRHDNFTLPESKTTALRRLQGMERKMDKDPVFAKLCLERFQDYQDKGYLVKKEMSGSDKKWFLPWFFAHHPTKKPRLVFDAASKSNGKCLNDFLLRGPDLLRSLPAVLIRFRRHLFALTGDIQEMFHQVRLAEKDWESQIILFRGMDRDMEPDELVMSVLFFGSASSPCSAIFTKNKNASLFEEKYLIAVRAIIRDFYMDDFLGGADSEESTKELRTQLTYIHAEGGFPLVKWNSSSKAVLESIPCEIRANGDTNLNHKTDIPYEKTLGLYWSPETDQFGFKVNFQKFQSVTLHGGRNPTKREIVSLTMSLFDPLGFLAPLKMKALFIIQLIWREKDVQWDDEIPDFIAEEWKLWVDELEKVEPLRIPRKLSSISLSSVKSIQLHIFCDASKEAYASAAYLRINTGGSVLTPFIMGKSRLAPLRGYGSIPRMELQAAVLGTRLAKSVLQSFEDDLKVDSTWLWSDSRTVLSWVRSTTGRFNQFVSNRVEEIWESTSPEQWRWVPTKDNPADDATRYSGMIDLTSDSRWLNCSTFLSDDMNRWPAEIFETDCVENDDAMEEMGAAQQQISDLEAMSDLGDITKFSNWMRLIRATAAVFWAKRQFKKIKPNYITVADINESKRIWTMKSQRESFPADYTRLLRGEGVEKTSRMKKLSPELDETGVIVCHGRIDNAATISSVKKPPILDPTHQYTKLMIEWFHRASGHFGQERLNNELRQHVWIIDARAAIKRCFATCQKCKERRAHPSPPEMGQLPMARISVGQMPFYHTGIDYFGPFYVKQNRSVVKRWGVVFSCLSCRAVHLELAESLDTHDMINALVRFVNIRGRPAHIWSDNGTNFVGAEREIRESLASLDQDVLRGFCSTYFMEWHFIPPASPHMGGSWERMVGLCKRILRTIMKEQNPTEGTLRTLLAEVSGILNSRPLTHVSPDFEDPECVTPNHLLNLPCIVGPTIAGEFQSADCFRKSWRYAQYLSQQFWKRWQKEYIPWLSKRQKWLVKQTPVRVGDLVIVTEDNAIKNQWRKGVVTATFPGTDGQIRSVEVKVATTDPSDKKRIKIIYLRRPVVKICSLGLNVNDASGEAGRENVSAEEMVEI